jgi:PAS domain S-box-containing protein
MTKVLIVDDEAEVRQFLSRSLEGCGYTITEACDGNEALEHVANEHPDVVITDLLMPVMDGFELALRIRANPDHAATEVIFFTGRASPRHVQAMAEAAGVTRVVTKPASVDEVQDAVGAVLHRKHPSSAVMPLSMTAEEHRSLIKEISEAEGGSLPIERSGLASDHRFRAFFERSLDAILLVTTNGQCLEANPTACIDLGYSHDELSRRSLWDVMPPESVSAAHELWERFLTAGRITAKHPLLTRDRKRRNAELSAVADIEPGVHLTMWRLRDSHP